MTSPSETRDFSSGAGSGRPVESVTPRPSSPVYPRDFESEFPHAGAEQAPSGEDAASLADGLKATARTATDALREQAAQFAQDVGDELTKTGEGQKARGAEALRQFARVIDSAAGELDSQSPTVARSVREAARRVNGLSENIANRNVNELLDSATRLARAQPALFLGGSVAAGFALARFLRSSARSRSGAPSPMTNPRQD
jgi:hypothetical protein